MTYRQHKGQKAGRTWSRDPEVLRKFEEACEAIKAQLRPFVPQDFPPIHVTTDRKPPKKARNELLEGDK